MVRVRQFALYPFFISILVRVTLIHFQPYSQQVTLDFQDSQGDPDSAVSAYGLLMDNGMDVSLGGVLSGETASIVAAAKADGLLVLTPSGSAKDCINGNDSAFRVCFNDPGQGMQYMQLFFLNATVSLSVIALLAAGATLPIFVFNRRAFSLTRRRKNVK